MTNNLKAKIKLIATMISWIQEKLNNKKKNS